MSDIRFFEKNHPFKLESGRELSFLRLGYHTFGQLNADSSNVVWVFHALTANSNPLEWWPGMMGNGKYFDPSCYFIICVNIPGSCYGSIGPEDIDPVDGQPYLHRFPLITVRDIVNAFEILRIHLGISSIEIAIGGSLGAYQALEWAIMQPGLIKNLIPIASAAETSPWFRGINESQRMAIEADATFCNGSKDGGKKGLAAARAITMSFFRSYQAYSKTQEDTNSDLLEHFNAPSYQKYQGLKLINRFSPYSYYTITRMVDSHNVGRKRGGVIKALQSIKARTLCIGIKNDLLMPASESLFLSTQIPGATYSEIDTEWGHDGFLIESEKLTKIVSLFLEN